MTTRTTRRLFLQRVSMVGTGIALGARRTPAGTTSHDGLPYTAEEIAGRLGISMAIYSKERLGARHIAAIRAAGINRVELVMTPSTFDLSDRAQISEVLAECRRQQVAVVSVHGNLQRKYDDPNEQRRREAAARLLDEIRFAEKAGASILVAHFGTSDPSRKTVTELLDQTKDLRVRLTVENMRGGLKPYADFVDRIGSDRFGLTVDIGHARDPDGVNPFVKKGRAGEVLALGGKRIWHVHLHETFRLKTQPDHRAPMHPEGIIEWGEVFAGLRAIDYRGVFLFEDGRGEEPEEWTRLAAAFPANFVARYGR
jgi:sugar phosphate isomerase/epimerase